METKDIQNSPSSMIQIAIDKGADLDKLEKLLSIQQKWEANEAKKEYHKAMAAFKANPPTIDKDKTVAYGNTKYNHASLSNVTAKINSELSKHGLSASWTTQQNGQVLVTCKITHIKGHSEETTLAAPADTSGAKNSIQAIGSTISYLERYTLLAILGLATSEQDDDGEHSEVEYINQDQNIHLNNLIADSNVSLGKFLKYMGVDKLDNIVASDYRKAENVLLQAKSKKATK